MKFFILITVLFITLTSYSQTPAADDDAFLLMMDKMGLTEDNLGYEPKGYWTRYPYPEDIPFILSAFNSLMAEPQRIYDFVRNKALAVEDYLSTEYMSKYDNSLLKTAFYCGISNVTGQFRPYGASLWSRIDSTEPLLNAIKSIYLQENRVFKFNAMGQTSDFPLIEKDLRKKIHVIDPEIRKVIAECLVNLTEAYRFCKIGLRNVDYKKAASVWRLRHLGETQFDGLEYYPDLEDCAKDIDMNSIYYAGYKMLESSEVLADTLTKILAKNKTTGLEDDIVEINTPIGTIVIAGKEDNIHRYDDLLLLIDLGGNDSYIGPVGANPSLSIPLSLCIDMSGNDSYSNVDEYTASQGAGIFGAGMLLDVSGDDSYESKRLSQGAAMLGIGILADLAGNDTYEMWTSGQGGAYFGVGLAIDVSGDDEYYLDGDGQGYGGVAGCGALVNRNGNDKYHCVIEASEVYRPDYHSKNGKLNYSYAQGCGIGRRGDIKDGHSWAGGMGMLIDIHGDDYYESADWSMGCGYWYGMGFLYDGNGNDKYSSASWAQAAGAHFCIGALIDEGGNDYHECWKEISTGMGFGHDYTIALFLERGGDDEYLLTNDGLGYAINMSQVFFFDTGGNDKYTRSTKSRGYGWNNFNSGNPPDSRNYYHLYSDQICFFADLDGKDTYLRRDYETGETVPDSVMSDGAEYFSPDSTEKDSLSNKRFFGYGKDFDKKISDGFYLKNKMKNFIKQKKN